MALLVFALALFAAVLISCLAARSVLSISVLFLVTGFLAGPGMFGAMQVKATDPVVSHFVELALFTVLFTDGMRITIGQLASAWHLPGRALFLGMPLTLGGTAVLAHLLLGMSWVTALLVGAVLSPTDPVFASAVVGRDEVPLRLRNLLNIESGFNDGLALPVVLATMAAASSTPVSMGIVLGESAMGVALGVAIAWAAIRLERSRFFGVAGVFEPLTAFSIGLLILTLSRLTHANEFLAAFAGGVTVASVSSPAREAFEQFGELLAELFKLAGVMIFGALILPRYIVDTGPAGWAFVFLALVLVRPVALAIALLRAELDWREWVAAAWFGPKGFSSVFFAIMILGSHIPDARNIFHVIAMVVAVSMIAHSSTDVLVVRWFRRAEAAKSGNQI